MWFSIKAVLVWKTPIKIFFNLDDIVGWCLKKRSTSYNALIIDYIVIKVFL